MFNVHVYPSTFEYETRILKVTHTLTARDLVDRVLVVAKSGRGLPREAQIDARRSVVRVEALLPDRNFWFKVLRFVEWSFRAFWRLRHESVGMVNCHSLSVLPLCVAVKLWHRAILVYEPHELETETATFVGPRQKVAKWVERGLIKHASRVIVVSKSIADHYRRDYELPDDPVVVMNVPELASGASGRANRTLRDRFGIPDDDLVFMYQGALEEERGVAQLMQAFQRVSPRKHVVFMGFGSAEPAIREAALVHSNVHLHPPVPPGDVMRYTSGADIGIALLAADCENHRCALPNKLFHYLHAGLPVIVSDLPEMGRLVSGYSCGWRVDNSPEAIARCVEALNSDAIAEARDGALRAAGELHWGKEADILEAIYRNLLRDKQQ